MRRSACWDRWFSVSLIVGDCGVDSSALLLIRHSMSVTAAYDLGAIVLSEKLPTCSETSMPYLSDYGCLHLLLSIIKMRD